MLFTNSSKTYSTFKMAALNQIILVRVNGQSIPQVISNIGLWGESCFIEITLRHGCSSVNLLYIFRTFSFSGNTKEAILHWILWRSYKNVFYALPTFVYHFNQPGLSKSAFYTYFFGKLMFWLRVFSLCSVFWIWCHLYRSRLIITFL